MYYGDKMKIQKDAGELLLFFYKTFANNDKDIISTQCVLDETGWDGNRINLTYNYLNDSGMLKSTPQAGNIQGAQIFLVERLYPPGINIVENQSEFKKTFGFEVNLGLLKFSWGLTEK